MAKLGVAPHVIERVLIHMSGTSGRCGWHLPPFGYLPEEKGALALWADCPERFALGMPQK